MSSLLKFLKQISPVPQLISRSLSTIPVKSNDIYKQPLFLLSANNNSWIWQQNDIIKTPINHIKPIKLPQQEIYYPLTEKPLIHKIIEEPEDNNQVVKEAARLIVIRRKKMKKHKLRKLRKKMRFEWGKIRQRREWNKEKLFQADLIAQCKEAEAFSAEKYVAEKLSQFKQASELDHMHQFSQIVRK